MKLVTQKKCRPCVLYPNINVFVKHFMRHLTFDADCLTRRLTRAVDTGVQGKYDPRPSGSHARTIVMTPLMTRKMTRCSTARNTSSCSSCPSRCACWSSWQPSVPSRSTRRRTRICEYLLVRRTRS